MKKGNKLSLNDLKVKSFVTNDQKVNIKGGVDGTTCLCCPCTCCCQAEVPQND
jgi:hypothetical protein